MNDAAAPPANGGDLHDPTAMAAVDIGRNCLWSYVTLLVWLRVLKRARVVFTLAPLILASLATWQVIAGSHDGDRGLLVATLSFLAGLFPLIYFALGIDVAIATSIRLAGRYRSVETDLRDLIIRFNDLDPKDRELIYDGAMRNFREIRSEAHTAPVWAFNKAEKLIERGDYAPVSISDLVPVANPPS